MDGKESKSRFNFKNLIIPRIKSIIKLVFESVKDKIDRNSRSNCFEIYGFDFMIDHSFNLWLIEVNTNPCLEESSPLLSSLIPRMINDAFKLTIDRIFPVVFNKKMPYYEVEGYKEEVNIWEFLGKIGEKNANIK